MPSLTQAEIDQLNVELVRQQNVVDSFEAAIPQQQARQAELEVADGAFKKFFDFYNDDIISKYDDERKALDGFYIASPIVEADIVGPASLDLTVRTTPTSPVTNVVRIAQFDGTPLASTNTNETFAISKQSASSVDCF